MVLRAALRSSVTLLLVAATTSSALSADPVPTWSRETHG